MKLRSLAFVMMCVGFLGTMRADTLHYIWTAPGYGTLDGTTFTDSNPLNANVVLTMTADSSHVHSSGPPGYAPNHFEITGPLTVTVAGVGTDTITDAVSIYEQYGLSTVFGVIDVTSGSGFNIAVAGCSFGCTPTDDLAGPHGPIHGSGFPASGTFNTAHGSLVFTGPGAPFYTTPGFQITGAPSALTPEPSSLVLLGSGALTLMLRMRSRRTRAQASSD